MDAVITQIHTLSTQHDSDLQKLKDFLRYEHDTLKANANQIDTALQALDPVQNTLGVAFLLAAKLNAGNLSSPQATFAFICNFLQVAADFQVRKASVPFASICKYFAEMAIEGGLKAMLQSLPPLRSAVQKLQPNIETLTPVHSEYLRVCLKAKAYHFACRLLDEPIFDISQCRVSGGGSSSSSNGFLTQQGFLSYFYYGALVRIGTREYRKAIQLLLVVLTCPATCLSAIQADAYKKYVLVCLKAFGELKPLPAYHSHILQRYIKTPSYVSEIADAFKQGDATAVRRILQDENAAIQADLNVGLVKQVLASMVRHKVRMLTKTYLTLSLAEIAREVGFEESQTAEAEALLFDMISEGDIRARIDQTTGNISFEDDVDQLDVAMVTKMQGKLDEILVLSERIAAFEQEVVTSESYIRRTAALEGDRAAAPSMAVYDFMDM